MPTNFTTRHLTKITVAAKICTGSTTKRNCSSFKTLSLSEVYACNVLVDGQTFSNRTGSRGVHRKCRPLSPW